jgi:hypothetical protein
MKSTLLTYKDGNFSRVLPGIASLEFLEELTVIFIIARKGILIMVTPMS